ncbi:MAG: 1-acyl-sn-glycerol-3-phosphate acyltransferase [Butyricicoccus sp.]|nr:1-acyl-sn-glycerol-3-phosphate acyltransferase [Butyricicoccus sp.]MBQ8584953.1 1-acyl-sn-glycerol-3-phosphate acyltransferase [Butyricicoccus sp.]
MHTIIWFFYFWCYLLVCIPATLYVIRLEKKGEIERADNLTKKFVRNWARRMLKMAGARVTVEGAENVPEGAAVYIGNHTSYFDIPLMLTYVGEPRGFMAKIESDKIPGIRTWMRRLHCLFVDRSSAASGATVLREGEKMLREGYSLTIFPEGTRSKTGELLEFKPGAFRIATMAKAPIVPVTIMGARAMMEDNGNRITSGDVKIVIHPAIDTASLSRPEIRTLPETVRDIIGGPMQK